MPNEQLALFGLTPDELPALAFHPLPDGTANDDEIHHCPNCSSEFNPDYGYDIDGESHCSDCVIHCEECETAHLSDDDEIGEATVGYRYLHRTPQTRILCDDCAFTCADCSNRFDASGDECTNASDDRICERCAEDYYSCDDCGCTVHVDDAQSTDDATYCRSCYPAHNEDEDEDGIHDYGYKPSPTFNRAIGETVCNMYFGVEIEVEGGREASIVDNDAFYCKNDGSLSNGFEIVSHPGSFAWWGAQSLDFMPKLARAGYRSYDTTTCGMHIHVSRSAFTNAEIARLAKFFRNSAQFIYKASRRASRSAMDQWARVDIGDDAHIERKVNDRQSCARYEALNLTPTHTIEFRLFRGTIDVPAVKRNIAFTYTLCQYAKTSGALNAQAYVQWLRDNPTIARELTTGLIEWVSSLL